MRTIGYVRVSTDRQADHGVSLEAQEAKIRAMATVQGAELTEVIVDGGESAKSLNRPGLQKLMTLINGGQVQAVIIAKLDRLTRSVKDLCALLELLERRKVALISGCGVAGHWLRCWASGDHNHGCGKPMGARGDWRTYARRAAPQAIPGSTCGQHSIRLPAGKRWASSRTGSRRASRARRHPPSARRRAYLAAYRHHPQQPGTLHPPRHPMAAGIGCEEHQTERSDARRKGCLEAV